MTAREAQRREQLKLARFVLDKLSQSWDESAHFTMTDDEWLARTLDGYTPSISLDSVEAELVPLERTLHSMTIVKGASPMFAAMLDRVRTSLKYLRSTE